MGLGSFNLVSLAQARQYAMDGKRLVINGKDPIEERKKEQIKVQLKQTHNLTFKEIAEACIFRSRSKVPNLGSIDTQAH